MTSSCSSHILVFPFPAQGHMVPLLDLTHQLALRGLTITVLVTPKNLPILNPLLTKHPSIQTLVLPFPNQPSIPPGVENVRDLPATYFRSMIHVMGELYDPLLRWFQSHDHYPSKSAPTAILSDFFLGWTYHLASQLCIPRFVFSPSGAFAFSISAYMWSELPERDDSADPSALFSFPNVPNSPAYPWWQLPSMYRVQRSGDPVSEFIRDCALSNSASCGIVFNSFDELERVYLEHVTKQFGVERVWAVGPLLPLGDDDASSLSISIARGSSSTDSDFTFHVLSWLDTCADQSVVFVCFGSQTVLANDQMEVVAEALDRSGVNFVWSTKEPTAGHAAGKCGSIPSGFEQSVVGRGFLMRGWAPQPLILRHRAVGSFLTHCGWNSVLEALVAGVPMLTWPMDADQYANATLLVDQIGVATRFCEGEETVPNVSELANAFRESISEMSERRERAAELSKAAMNAVKGGGSSFRCLDRLVDHLCEPTRGDNKVSLKQVNLDNALC